MPSSARIRCLQSLARQVFVGLVDFLFLRAHEGMSPYEGCVQFAAVGAAISRPYPQGYKLYWQKVNLPGKHSA